MPASAKARKQLLTDFRRTEIIAAALKTFGSKGFAATRAEDIAAQAGIAKGTLYLYFGSKEDIYVAAVQHAMDQLNQRVRDRLQAAEGIQQRITAFITERLEFWLEQKSLYRLLLTIGREPQHRKQTNAVLRSSKQSIVALLEEGVAAGELNPQPFDAIAWAALDMLRGANDRRLDGIATHSIDEDARFIIELTLKFVGYKDSRRAEVREISRGDA
ncbi:MAG TPA: TetR/AcrR family transcriptional regulator [Granulicella sp.]|jgi:AcrR family transcriptional regulator|nr:TetR/AcrR family transcriptional regulator [Granulicella sp.]